MPKAHRNPWLPAVAALSLVGLVGCGSGFGAVGSAATGSSSTYATGSGGKLSLFVEPDAGATPIVSTLAAAKSSIQMEVYMLTDPDIENALLGAAKRGVNVQVMLDPAPYNPSDPGNPLTTNQVAEKLLTAGGAHVQWSDPTFKYTHAKTVVVDGQTAIIATLNFTNSGVGGNREYGVIDSDPQDVQDLVSIFQADWQRTTFTPTAPDLVVSPTNSRPKLEALFQGAQRSIVIQDEEFSDPEAIALLGQKAKAGVDVEVDLASPAGIPDNQTAAEQLMKLGVSVKYLNTPNIHAKMIVADGTSGYIGSVNLSANSMANNREVGILLSDPGLISTLTSTFATDWQNSQPFPAAAPVPSPRPTPHRPVRASIAVPYQGFSGY